MRPFTVKYPGKKCPGCSETLKVGDSAVFAVRTYPYDSQGQVDSGIYANPRDLAIWHETCVNYALRGALCPACMMLHKDIGICLL